MIALDVIMPENCGVCPCIYRIGKRMSWCSVARSDYDKSAKKHIDDDNMRPEWCPWIELREFGSDGNGMPAYAVVDK